MDRSKSEFLTCANDGPLVLEPALFSNSAGSGASDKLEGELILLFLHQTTTSMMHRSEHVETTAATSTTTP